jgi:hypothetical protein
MSENEPPVEIVTQITSTVTVNVVVTIALSSPDGRQLTVEEEAWLDEELSRMRPTATEEARAYVRRELIPLIPRPWLIKDAYYTRRGRLGKIVYKWFDYHYDIEYIDGGKDTRVIDWELKAWDGPLPRSPTKLSKLPR